MEWMDPCSGNQNDTHGVGETRAWTPAGQDDDDITLLEEASHLAWIFTHKHTQTQ